MRAHDVSLVALCSSYACLLVCSLLSSSCTHTQILTRTRLLAAPHKRPVLPPSPPSHAVPLCCHYPQARCSLCALRSLWHRHRHIHTETEYFSLPPYTCGVRTCVCVSVCTRLVSRCSTSFPPFLPASLQRPTLTHALPPSLVSAPTTTPLRRCARSTARAIPPSNTVSYTYTHTHAHLPSPIHAIRSGPPLCAVSPAVCATHLPSAAAPPPPASHPFSASPGLIQYEFLSHFCFVVKVGACVCACFAPARPHPFPPLCLASCFNLFGLCVCVCTPLAFLVSADEAPPLGRPIAGTRSSRPPAVSAASAATLVFFFFCC